MTILAVVQAVQDIVGAVTGIRAAPDYPPDNIGGIFPISIVYPPRGNIKDGPGYLGMTALHQIVIELHFPRTDLSKAVEASISYIDSIPNALFKDPTIGGSASTFEDIEYTFGSMSWGEPPSLIPTFGIRFTVNGIKLIGTAT